MPNYYDLFSRIYYIQIQLKNLKKLLIQYIIFSYYTKKVHIKFLS